MVALTQQNATSHSMGEQVIDPPNCLAFDPAPKKPRADLPPGACDCHWHVFGPQERYPFASPRSYTPPEAPLDAYLHMAKTLGIERFVLVQPSVYGADNSAMLDAMAILGERCRGIAVINEDVTDKELEAFDHAGIRGVRFNVLNKGGLELERITAMAERIAPLGWHIQLFAGVDQIADVFARLRDLPVDIVFDHLGYPVVTEGPQSPGFSSLLRLIDGGRCWVKLSGAYRVTHESRPYADTKSYATALISAAPERLLWGTDWPHTELLSDMPNDGDLCDLLAEWIPDAAIRHDILVTNPANLYGFN